MPVPEVPERSLSKQEIFQGIRRVLAFLLLTSMSISVMTHSGGVVASLFQYHSIMLAVAFIGCLPEVMSSVALMKKRKSGLPREELELHHQLSAMAFNSFAALGIAAVEYTKYANGYPHIVTIHGFVGVLCGVAIVLQAVLGNVLRFVLPRGSSVRTSVRSVHGVLSITIAVTGFMCLLGGVLSTPFAKEVLPSSPLRCLLAFSGPLFALWGYMR